MGRRLLAVLAGAVVAAGIMSALDFWQQRLMDQLRREEAEAAVNDMIAAAEHRIAAALASLDELAQAGIESCRGHHLGALRRVAGANPWIKDVIVAEAGAIRCSATEALAGRRELAAALAAGGEGPRLAVLNPGERDAQLLVIRPGGGASLLGAVVPVILLAPFTAGEGRDRIRLLTAEGAVIFSLGTLPDVLPDGAPVRASGRSERFGLRAEIAILPSALPSGERHERMVLVVAGASAVMLLLAFAAVWPLRRGDPVSEFERAIARGEFIPYYQPVVDIRTGRLRGAEVLIRWRKADGSVATPATFIPFAESSGLIVPLTRALMRQVRADVGEALKARPEVRIGFNLAAQHFLDDTVVDDVRDVFGASPIRMQQIVLEVTERQPLENLVAARRVIASLQGLGCRVAIDDVGTGHGGLSYMLKLGADVIKIDKLFIDGIGTEHHSTKIVESLVDLARTMRMEVVAEGVESFEQVVRLRDAGILAAQGYAFCPPLPAGSFLRLLEAIAPTEAVPELDGAIETHAAAVTVRAAAA